MLTLRVAFAAIDGAPSFAAPSKVMTEPVAAVSKFIQPSTFPSSLACTNTFPSFQMRGVRSTGSPACSAQRLTEASRFDAELLRSKVDFDERPANACCGETIPPTLSCGGSSITTPCRLSTRMPPAASDSIHTGYRGTSWPPASWLTRALPRGMGSRSCRNSSLTVRCLPPRRHDEGLRREPVHRKHHDRNGKFREQVEDDCLGCPRTHAYARVLARQRCLRARIDACRRRGRKRRTRADAIEVVLHSRDAERVGRGGRQFEGGLRDWLEGWFVLGLRRSSRMDSGFDVETPRAAHGFQQGAHGRSLRLELTRTTVELLETATGEQSSYLLGLTGLSAAAVGGVAGVDVLGRVSAQLVARRRMPRNAPRVFIATAGRRDEVGLRSTISQWLVVRTDPKISLTRAA